MFINQKEGFLDILGKDFASTYQTTCVYLTKTIECVGHGVNYVENKRFLYKSTFTVSNENGKITIEENWEGKFSDGKTISGKTLFKRKEKPASR